MAARRALAPRVRARARGGAGALRREDADVPTRSLRDLARLPIVAAPMAGGPTTVELVREVGAAGGLGFVAAGYRRADAVAGDVRRLRAESTDAFGVNVFVPGAPTSEPAALATYVDSLRADAARLGVELGEARWDDDDWDAKVSLLLDDPVPAVSFTFGCPPGALVAELQARGTLVIATVTSEREAKVAVSTGVDALCAQGVEAGAHRGSFDNQPGEVVGLRALELVAKLAPGGVPVVAAGGIVDATEAQAALAAGAVAVQCGTAFLLCDESGTSATHRASLRDERFTETAFTRAFSGRSARGLVNEMMRANPDAPTAYPEINNATRPLRAVAAAAGDADRVSLWAGTGWRRAVAAPARDVVARLAAGIPTNW
jgi:nitronate monooxygenase